jgi:outer membrane protein
MKKTFLAALVAGLSVASLASAQSAPAPPKPDASGFPARAPRIAAIDMNRVSTESLLGKGYQAKLEKLKNDIDAEAKKKQSDLDKLDQAIKALQAEIEKQGSTLSPEAGDKKRQEIVRKSRERQAFLEDGQADLQRMRERAQQQAQGLNGEFLQKVKPLIDAVVKEKGLDILLTDDTLLFVSGDFDISREVIAKVDAAERAARPAATPKPKPAATP